MSEAQFHVTTNTLLKGKYFSSEYTHWTRNYSLKHIKRTKGKQVTSIVTVTLLSYITCMIDARVLLTFGSTVQFN